MSKQWKLKPKAPGEFFEKFPEIAPITVQLLYNRDIVDPEIVQNFLDPQYDQLHSPFLFRDMQKAVERIWQAITNKEKVVVYSDYDADAVTANAVLQQTFRYLDYPIASYIPDRFTEGYGLNIEAFQKLLADGSTVVITVDCGTNSIDVADFCNQNGIDLIITDHHEITAATPQSFALINPKNPKDVYPEDQITGVGVAYKLASAILSQKDKVVSQKNISQSEFVPGWDKWLLDLVAIGTVADCHSLMGENRILVRYGLQVLQKTKWLGLRTLMTTAGIDLSHTHLDTHTLGFVIAPRINAAGRLEHANIALDLLLATNPAEAQLLSAQLEQVNKRRQEITMRVVSEAQEQAVLISDRKILLVSHAEWPKGVVGLAAGRLAEQYKKPVIVLERGEIESTGSVRTGNKINVVEFLKAGSEYLVKFGGHKQAAGLTLKTEHINKFYTAILEYVEQQSEQETEIVAELEAELVEAEINFDTYHGISQLEPYGIGNPKPLLLLRNARIISTRVVGSTKNHLQLQLQVGATTLQAIAFNFGKSEQTIVGYGSIDCIGELIADSWNGHQTLKFKISDIKPYDEEVHY